MHAFKDSAGRDWQLRLTFADAEAIQENLKIDIGIEADLQKLFTDRRTFFGVVGMLLADQIEKAGVTLDDLKRTFDGETWEAATTALEAEVYFFSPNRRIAEKIMPAVKRRQEAMAGELQKRIEAGEFDPKIGRLELSKLATVSPESAASNGPVP